MDRYSDAKRLDGNASIEVKQLRRDNALLLAIRKAVAECEHLPPENVQAALDAWDNREGS